MREAQSYWVSPEQFRADAERFGHYLLLIQNCAFKTRRPDFGNPTDEAKIAMACLLGDVFGPGITKRVRRFVRKYYWQEISEKGEIPKSLFKQQLDYANWICERLVRGDRTQQIREFLKDPKPSLKRFIWLNRKQDFQGIVRGEKNLGLYGLNEAVLANHLVGGGWDWDKNPNLPHYLFGRDYTGGQLWKELRNLNRWLTRGEKRQFIEGDVKQFEPELTMEEESEISDWLKSQLKGDLSLKIVELRSKRMSQQQIADELFCSRKTVNKYLKRAIKDVPPLAKLLPRYVR